MRLSRLPELLAGHGVTLRRWRPVDAALLHDAVTSSIEHLRPWMAWITQEPQTLEERRARLAQWEREWLDGGDVAMAILVDAGAVAGSCGLHRRRGPDILEIGYWLHPAFLRRGIATAAARLLTDAAFTVPGIDWVEIHHDEANLASRGVPRRLGYEYVGEHRNERPAPAETGIDCIWRINRAAWPVTPEAPVG